MYYSDIFIFNGRFSAEFELIFGKQKFGDKFSYQCQRGCLSRAKVKRKQYLIISAIFGPWRSIQMVPINSQYVISY